MEFVFSQFAAIAPSDEESRVNKQQFSIRLSNSKIYEPRNIIFCVRYAELSKNTIERIYLHMNRVNVFC